LHFIPQGHPGCTAVVSHKSLALAGAQRYAENTYARCVPAPFLSFLEAGEGHDHTTVPIPIGDFCLASWVCHVGKTRCVDI
jgi:hypothetical protein